MSITITPNVVATPAMIDALVADLNLSGLARRIDESICPLDKPAGRTDRVRHADIVDPITGEHVWFDQATGRGVTVPERHLATFRLYVARRGMVLDTPKGMFATEGFGDERFDVFFERLTACVNA